MIEPPSSLVVSPISYADCVQTIVGVSPEGHIYLFHEHTRIPAEGKPQINGNEEDHIIWITRWAGEETFVTIWEKNFIEYNYDPQICWDHGYNIIDPKDFDAYAHKNLEFGTQKRLDAYQLWTKIVADPYDFLLKTMTLEVL